MAEAQPGAGDIEIELDGKSMMLKPSLQACMTISGIGGGLNAAVQRCLQLDFETISQIITAGLGLNPAQARQVPDAVFRTGLINLHGPCIDFINVVANGGRPLPDDEGDEPGGEAGPLEPA